MGERPSPTFVGLGNSQKVCNFTGSLSLSKAGDGNRFGFDRLSRRCTRFT